MAGTGRFTPISLSIYQVTIVPSLRLPTVHHELSYTGANPAERARLRRTIYLSFV